MKIVEVRGSNLSFPLAEHMDNTLTLFRKCDALVVKSLRIAG